LSFHHSGKLPGWHGKITRSWKIPDLPVDQWVIKAKTTGAVKTN
jgi:hypothetical protein